MSAVLIASAGVTTAADGHSQGGSLAVIVSDLDRARTGPTRTIVAFEFPVSE